MASGMASERVTKRLVSSVGLTEALSSEPEQDVVTQMQHAVQRMAMNVRIFEKFIVFDGCFVLQRYKKILRAAEKRIFFCTFAEKSVG